MEALITPSVKTGEAVDHERHGTRAMGFGQFVAANDAICHNDQRVICEKKKALVYA